MYAGLEFGAECYCGHRVQSNKSSESECQMNCTGNPSLVCGGVNRLSVFRLKLSQESARRRKFDVTQWPKRNPCLLTPTVLDSWGFQTFLHYNPHQSRHRNPFKNIHLSTVRKPKFMYAASYTVLCHKHFVYFVFLFQLEDQITLKNGANQHLTHDTCNICLPLFPIAGSAQYPLSAAAPSTSAPFWGCCAEQPASLSPAFLTEQL